MHLSRFPRVRLCHTPTPLEPMPRLSDALGGPRLFVKRDDCTGLATGGNKTRKLDFLMGEALERGADCVVTQGAVQSNHVRQTAAAATRLGLDCVVLLERRVPDTAQDYEVTGNVFLDRLFGAEIRFCDTGGDMNAAASSSPMPELRARAAQEAGGSGPISSASVFSSRRPPSQSRPVTRRSQAAASPTAAPSARSRNGCPPASRSVRASVPPRQAMKASAI